MLYSHLLNHTNTKTLIHNNVDYIIKIPMHHWLDCVTKLFYKSCFITLADLDATSTSSNLPIIFYDCNGISIPIAGNLKTELLNNIKIYGNKETVDSITCLVNEYPSI